ncbi:hypothetical protein EB796_022152 [Bugula neritina]|uniref:Protein BCCIP homolog n=1 Tax=Bugula neritina TaxID=10212 RepID=A0A7J7J271_BUGNE|nr:hypothetical protein EB796_022152 [Bugula neritina]
MATSKKKTRVDLEIDETLEKSYKNGDDCIEMDDDEGAAHSSSSEGSDMEDDDSEMEVTEKVNVEFEARNPEEADFHGIRQLLLQLFLKSNIDISAITDWILTQRYVGSVIKQYLDDGDDDEDESSMEEDVNQVYGVITCLNITKYKDKPCTDQIKKHLLQKLANSKSSANQLQAILENPSNNIGWLINERFVNIPAQIAVPSFQSIRQEMNTANQKGEDYHCSHYIMVAKKFRMKTLPKPGKKRISKKPLESEIYSNGEEEFFAEAAEFRATFTVAEERDSGVVQQWDSELEDQYEPLREIIVIKANELENIMIKVENVLSQTNS